MVIVGYFARCGKGCQVSACPIYPSQVSACPIYSCVLFIPGLSPVTLERSRLGVHRRGIK